ncbi:MAG: hypothetical protein Kow00114_19200 [Kiloniellaceae bacterium]
MKPATKPVPGSAGLSRPVGEPNLLLGPWLLALSGCELLVLFAGTPMAETVSHVLLLGVPVIGWRRLRLREGYLLALCGVLLALAWLYRPDAWDLVLRGLDRASFLAAFILLMGLLREGGITSPAVLQCGTYVTQQPPQRRFLAVFLGAHFFSVLINLGALSLLAPIIQRGVRGDYRQREDLDEIALLRERRQLTALLRGFAWFLLWAPTAVTQAILPTLIPGVDPARLLVTGICLALLMLAVGWAEDALRWLPLRRRLRSSGRLPQREKLPFPRAALTRLGAVSALLFGLTLLFTAWGGVLLVGGVMLAAPIVLLVWVFMQQRPAGETVPLQARVAGTGRRLASVTALGLPSFQREAVSLGAAGFIGTLAAALVPAEQVASLLSVAEMPGWLFLSLLSLTVWFFGLVALSPITTAVFLGSLVTELGAVPADPTNIVLAIAAGTAICTLGAPFASGTLMLARASGYTGVELTWKWNLIYTMLSAAVLAGVYALLTSGIFM